MHHDSLISFPCVNHAIRAITARLLFRSIALEVYSRKQLRLEVNGWCEILSRNSCLVYVRHVEVLGSMPAPGLDEDQLEHPYNRPDWNGYDEICHDRSKEGKKSSKRSISKIKRSRVLRSSLPPNPFPTSITKHDEAWQPLVELLDVLPGVSGLTWNLASSAFPLCVLDCIEWYEPRCKLYHKNIRFASLRAPQLDESAKRLAESQSLHRISVYYNTWSPGRVSGEDYNEEAIQDMVAGMAPNVKKANMIHCDPASSRQLNTFWLTNRAAWTGFNGVSLQLKKATLTDFQLICPTNAETLKSWSERVEFGQIRRPTLSISIKDSALDYAASNCSFPLLEDLFVSLDRDDMDSWTQTRQGLTPEEFREHTVRFISSLAPLKKFTLSGTLEQEVLDCVLEHHGCTLQQLCLLPYKPDSLLVQNEPFEFTKSHVEQLQRACPLLEDLRIPIKRRNRDMIELQTYQAFRKFAGLRVLFLELDCSNTGATDPAQDVRDYGDDSPNDPYFNEYFSNVLTTSR